MTISDNKLCMHDLIQEMGWEVIRQQSIEVLGKRSRLWVNEDVIHVLTTNTIRPKCAITFFFSFFFILTSSSYSAFVLFLGD